MCVCVCVCMCVRACVGHWHLAPLTGFQMLERLSTGLMSLFILHKRLYLVSQTLYGIYNITPIFMSSICTLSSSSSCLIFPISCLMSALISSPLPQSCPHFTLKTACSLYPGTTSDLLSFTSCLSSIRIFFCLLPSFLLYHHPSS